MNAKVMCLALLAALALFAPHAPAAPVHEYWAGSYNMFIDGGKGTLKITYSKTHCGKPASCMEILYYGPKGEKSAAEVEGVDSDGYHMIFRLYDRPRSRFDLYLFRSDNARMIGTMQWATRTVGLYAIKEGKSEATPLVPRSSLQPDGSILIRYPDGRTEVAHADSGPPRRALTKGEHSTERTAAHQDVQPLSFPDPIAGSDMDTWLRGVNDNLTRVIYGLFGYDGAALQTYMQGEDTHAGSLSSKVYYRADFIRRWLGYK